MSSLPSLLILTFSPIRSDPRVLKQVELLKGKYQVSTCAYGAAPDGIDSHFPLPTDSRGWTSDRIGLITRQYGRVYNGMTAVQEARKILPVGHFDIILANDLNALPLALDLKPRLGVHADLHEYAPSEKESDLKWRLFVAPFMRWICRKQLPMATSVTTVSQGIADEYHRRFGVEVGVVTNAAPYLEAEPTPTAAPLKVIYSGAGQRYRKIELIIDAMKGVDDKVQLDFVVMPNEPDYVDELKRSAANLPNVRFIDPVPYEELVSLIRNYDVAMCFLPNSTFNLQNALPNKFFEAVQARIGVITGPSPAMVALVESYGLGVVTKDFSTEALRTALNGLTETETARWKTAANDAAWTLSAESQVALWDVAISDIAQRAG
ncbi:glycosyltransferase involved in cell wall biosynthesis [Arthrobacter stackebrandtii]|uniref:Glycosyltransferase involved in cell wall biosynthesis n=1 Tax=Arthrobacter stackebrandtii TaxID=272161 RepID=A0ABS4YY84_9MICC|nr:glycosyltransferase family 4 protein [Arthrobacter stackebrandtii]MBP2413767.1 glycosyltransferase involved in cell wall biosynthesis [Arthrobacter stackebrandtii]PYG98707.1 glycosyltransferase [Arthrobacter stackebrandtii]